MLTAARNTPYRNSDQLSIPMAAATKIFAGSIVMLNATGFAVDGRTAANLTFVGRAEETVDNLVGVDGAKSILVYRKKAFKWNNLQSDLIGQADLFKTAYVVDNETLAKTSNSSARSAAGRIVGVDPDGVWIE